MAPPNSGSLEVVMELLGGRRFGPLGPDYPAALLGTFPSGYQLLPRPEHGQVVDTGNPEQPVGDLWDPRLWQERGWGLADEGQAEVIARLLPHVSDPATGRPGVVEEGPGDGTVLRSSALMDRRLGDRPWTPTLDSPIAWEDVLFLFNNHLGLTKDRVFTDNVLYCLLEEPREARAAQASGS